MRLAMMKLTKYARIQVQFPTIKSNVTSILDTINRILRISLSTTLFSICYTYEDTSPFNLAVSHKYPSILGTEIGI